MQKNILLVLTLLLFANVTSSLAQNKVPFRAINAPNFMMGENAKYLSPNYDKIVVTFTESQDLTTTSKWVESNFPNLSSQDFFNEYHAVVFENTKQLTKGELKRLFKTLQKESNVSSVTPYYNLDGGEVFYFDLLNFKRKAGVSDEALTKALQKYNLQWLERYESPIPNGISIAKVPKGKSIFKLSKKLHATGLFTYIYPMSNRLVSEDYTPNDTDYLSQWHLNQDNDADIDAPEAWELTTGNSNLVIAIAELDGFDLTHPDLAGNVVSPYNAFLDVYDAQYLDNSHTHGTRVIGCTSAITDNNQGVAGVAFSLKVMPIILTGATSNSVNAATLQRAADHIISNGNVVAMSNSWSGSGYDAAEEDQFMRIRTLSRSGLGSVILGSTGNYSTMQIRYPACYRNVVGVGRTTQADFRYSSSNYHDSVDVSAPGSSILTLDILGAVGATGDYTTASGTSFSTPISAGVVGLMASINPYLSGEELKDLLEQSCEKVGNYPYHPVVGRTNGIWDQELGYGRVNALHAVLLADTSTTQNDFCSNSFPLNQVTSTQFCFQNASLLGATQSEPSLNCSGETSTLAQDVWFKFTAVNAIMDVSVTPLGTGLDPVVAVYNSCGGILVDCVNSADGQGFSEILSLTNLNVNQSYYIRVYHFTDDESQASSFTFDVCAFVPGVACNAPSGLQVSSATANSGNFSWNAVTGASSYELAVRRLGGSDWISYQSNSTFLVASQLACNTGYESRIRTVCSNGNVSAWSSGLNFNTQSCTACLVPFNVTATNITSNSALLSWENYPPTCTIDGFDGELFEGTGSNGTSVVSWGDLTSNSYFATGLQPNTVYTYIVRHDCDCGILGRSIYVYHTFVTPGATYIDLEPNAQSSILSINGDTLDVTASFSNNGTSNAGSSQVAYYLSTSPYFSTFDYLLDTDITPNLNAGTSVIETSNIKLCNTSIPDGTYYLGFYVDNTQNVTENNEVNNFLYWPNLPINLDCNPTIQYFLDLASSPVSGGLVTGEGTYNSGVSATIEAFPNAGWQFVNWTENGVEISTATSTSILMNSDKTILANFETIPTGINETVQGIEYSFSPNPTDGKVTINLSDELKGATCAIYAIDGKFIASYELPQSTNQIKLEASAGTYFLQLEHPSYDNIKAALLIVR